MASTLNSETNSNLDYIPRHTASFWSTKSFGLADAARLRLGGGIVYSGKSISTSDIWSIVTRSHYRRCVGGNQLEPMALRA